MLVVGREGLQPRRKAFDFSEGLSPWSLKLEFFNKLLDNVGGSFLSAVLTDGRLAHRLNLCRSFDDFSIWSGLDRAQRPARILHALQSGKPERRRD